MSPPDLIDAAARRLRAGGLVAFATETVYGLGADAGSRTGVAAIYATKGRPADHPLIVHVADLEQARFWADWTPRAERLARAAWPGPLTLILPRRAEAPAWACAGERTIGLRCPVHPLAQALLRRFRDLGGQGVAAPSANRFGRISPTTADHVRADLADAIARDELLVLDGGASEHGLESTIVDLSRDTAVLLRPGAWTAAEIASVLGEPVEVSGNVIDPKALDAAAPRVPGSLASHYAPRKGLRLVATEGLEAAVADTLAKGARPGVLRLAPEDRTGMAQTASRAAVGQWIESAAGPAAYGHQLYDSLRRLDAGPADVLWVEAPPRGPAWQAVWDRLMRAATPPLA